MKRTVKLVCATVLVVLVASAPLAAQETLADRARAARAAKTTPPAKIVITNDTLGIQPKPAPEPSAGGAPSSGAGAASGTAAPAKDAGATGAKSAEDIQKLAAEWAAKINKVKEEIAFLEREGTVASREAQIRAAEFYGSGGNRLQNEAKWLADQKAALQESDKKKQDLAAAKAKLEEYRDGARRAGVPANLIP